MKQDLVVALQLEITELPQEEQRAAVFAAVARLLRPYEITLANELARGCLHLNPGEPFFVLRAQDVSAPSVVEYWALQNNSHTPVTKIEEARAVADRMRRYVGPKKDPD